MASVFFSAKWSVISQLLIIKRKCNPSLRQNSEIEFVEFASITCAVNSRGTAMPLVGTRSRKIYIMMHVAIEARGLCTKCPPRRRNPVLLVLPETGRRVWQVA